MSAELFIPAKTQEKMVNGAAKGNRHATMIQIAIPLLGSGMAPEAIFAQLRSTFQDKDKTDKEIRDVIDWCIQKNPEPSGYGDRSVPQQKRQWTPPVAPKDEPKLSPREAVLRCVGDAWVSEASWSAKCKEPIPVDPVAQCRALLLALYGPDDKVNIVGKHFIAEDGKAKPQGGGKTLTRDGWLDYIADKGLPVSASGIWVRPNPCGEGTGKDGAITDGDILDFRFAFLESDTLSATEQLSFYDRTGLPIAAIISSGGESSCHAWVRVDASTLEEYREKVKGIYRVVEAYGMDKANKNASRLSRLAGAHRTVGASGDGIQRLIYLNGECRGNVITPDFIDKMEARLKQPPPSKTPMLETVFVAGDRYDDLIKNKGKTGLMTGFESFDRMSGGLKKKRMYVVAAESKCGKSSFAFNILNHVAVRNNLPAAVFSMEMDRDEITDILVAMNGSVDRNVFNTGNFYGMDMERSFAALKKIGNAPLYIFDSPIQTPDTIREEAIRLKAQTDLSLIVIDYLQLCSPKDGFQMSREQQVAVMGQAFRALCSEVDVPVIVISQVNDDGKLRESRAVGHAAHAIMLLEEMDPSNNGPERELRLKIERARSMPRGEYPILFEVLFSRMSDGKHSTEKKEPEQQNNLRKSKKPWHN